ncbi:hypothetical protein D3C78_763420 [compost metagenome]
MRKTVRRLMTALIIVILLLGGAAWWLLAYIAPDEPRDMAYTPIDLKEKALDVIRSMKPELVLTEDEINALIKMHMKEKYASVSEGEASLWLAEDVQLEGATFELEEDELLAHLNILYKGRIRAQLDAVYTLEWQETSIVLTPQSLSMKSLSLPLGLLERIEVPLNLPALDVISLNNVQFKKDKILLVFKLQLINPF